MPCNNTALYPPLWHRLYSVWYRHVRVYTRHLISNGFPPFLEPLIFLGGIGLGMVRYVTSMDGMPYLQFLGTGLPLTAAMYTSAFECSYGTWVRMEYEGVYDGMLAAPLTAWDLMVGEILFAGSKGAFFSFAVITVVGLFQIIPLPVSYLAILIGFLTGIMFACLSLLVTSFVKNMNHFNFYMTGLLSPMFFFSGVVFPIHNLPRTLWPVAEFFPLTHAVRLARAFALTRWSAGLLWDLAYIAVFCAVVGFFAVRRLGKKLIN
jgi:lipooligosaccharide transport system permease protein